MGMREFQDFASLPPMDDEGRFVPGAPGTPLWDLDARTRGESRGTLDFWMLKMWRWNSIGFSIGIAVKIVKMVS